MDITSIAVEEDSTWSITISPAEYDIPDEAKSIVSITVVVDVTTQTISTESLRIAVVTAVRPID
jgi:hypothetical protein